MSPHPLRERIIGALRLSPMTIAQLATCLDANHWSVRSEVAELHAAGVLTTGGFRSRQQIHRLVDPQQVAA